MIKRPRRNRKSPSIRAMVEETILRPSDLIAPFFVMEGKNKREEIKNFPNVFRLSVDQIVREAEKLHKRGIPAIALFPTIPQKEKDLEGSGALDEKGIIPRALITLKKEIPSLCLITDIALDAYTSHGHDGLIGKNKEIDNDASLVVLAKMALLHAEAGADFVGPSDMMDGRVRAIRVALDKKSFSDVGIMAYSAKYASSLYGPYREALGSKLQFGDKKTYQMNPANAREALLEATLDVEEGADIVLVKPGLYYLDILAKLRANLSQPIAAFHVSGEYAMVMAAHEKGYLSAPHVFYEALLSMKRAGADLIISYAAPLVLDML